MRCAHAARYDHGKAVPEGRWAECLSVDIESYACCCTVVVVRHDHTAEVPLHLGGKVIPGVNCGSDRGAYGTDIHTLPVEFTSGFPL
jgi:hypothetical protein